MKNDRLILSLLKQGRLVVDCDTGYVYNQHGRKLGSLMKNREYIRIRIKHRGVTRSLRAHRVVYICVFGLPGPDMEIDHVWGPKWFNRPDNLEAVTGAENVRRAYKTGKCNPHNERCDRGRYRKKTDEDVRQELEDENESAPF